MPYINIRLSTALDTEQQSQLYQETTSLMNKVMGKRREVTVVHIEESKPHLWAVNGSALSSDVPVGAYVDIKVTEGTNTPKEKSEMILQTIEMLKDIIGTIQEACYVVIDDVPANSWGYNGKTQAERAISKL